MVFIFFQQEIFKRNHLFFLLTLLLFVIKYAVLAEKSVTLGWDPSSDPNAAGYSIYYGTVTHQYTEKVSAGNGTTVTIGGLIEGQTYYFAATTYDIFNQESGFSDEMPYMVPFIQGNPPITKYFVAGQNITFSVASGTNQSSYNWTFDTDDIESATNTDLTLTNLTADQAGTYSVTVTDDTGATTNITFDLEVYPTAAATLTQSAYADGQYSFNVSGVPNFQYVVQASTNLVDWDSMETNIAPFAFIDPEAGQYSQRFYRAFSTYALTGNVFVDATSVATLSHLSYINGQYSFNISGSSDYSYVVQASTNLIAWDSIQTNKAPFKFVDSNAGRFKQRFYRVSAIVLLPQSK